MAITSRHKGHSFNFTAHSGQVTWCQQGWKTISLLPSRHTTHFKSRLTTFSAPVDFVSLGFWTGLGLNRYGSSDVPTIGGIGFSLGRSPKLAVPSVRSSFINSSSSLSDGSVGGADGAPSIKVWSGAEGWISSNVGSRMLDGLLRCSFSDQMAAMGCSDSVSMLRRPIETRIRSRFGRTSCNASDLLWLESELTDRKIPLRFLLRFFCSTSRKDRRLRGFG